MELLAKRGVWVAEGASSAHSTSVMCSTSLGRSMGRFIVLVMLCQWRAVVYLASGLGGFGRRGGMFICGSGRMFVGDGDWDDGWSCCSVGDSGT